MNRDGSFPMTYSDECEVYVVRDAVWKKAEWNPTVLCIGYLERRIGRKLKARGYPDHSLNETPGTQ